MYREQVRLTIARQQCPRVLIWAGSLLLVLSLLTWAENPTDPVSIHVLDIAMALGLVVCGLVILATSLRDEWVPWVFAAAMAVLVIVFAYEITVVKEVIGFVYLVIVLTAFPPATLAWRPFVAGATVMMITVVILTTTWTQGDAVDWILASLTALCIGALLLRFRIAGLRALADAQDHVQRLATTDELTGLLNRHGLQSQLDRLTSMATRLGQPMFAMFVDIDGLKAANDRHGHGFGDEVIVASAQAVIDSVRAGDLVVRWGGDEIVVIGIGEHPDVATFSHRLDDNVAAIGIDRAKWPGHLSVGFAEGAIEGASIVDLIERADFDMYGRRKAR